MAFAQPYGYYQPPPKKRGLKRIIFGGLGIVANTIGLFVMPVVLLLIASVVSVLTGGELHELGPEGGSFRAEGLAVYSVAVPAEEAAEAECTFDGLPTEAVSPASAGIEVTHAGRTYIEVYDVSTTGDHDVHVSCTGVSNVGYTEMGMLGALISMGVGVIIPIVLGALSLALLIWGIIARVQS